MTTAILTCDEVRAAEQRADRGRRRRRRRGYAETFGGGEAPGEPRQRDVDLDPEVVAMCKEHLPTWSAGSLDDPLQFVPREVINTRHRAPWDVIAGGLPEHEGMPAGA